MKKAALHFAIALLVLALGFVLGVVLGRVAQSGAIRSMAGPSVAVHRAIVPG